jgi:predicted DCC family thiol-disulfide oxidoreductase YuxK
VNTEIPDKDAETTQGWVLYDGECSLCAGAAARFAPMLHRHRFNLAPLQMAWVQKQIGLKPKEPLTEMKLLAADARVYGGAEALAQIARRIWWAWPLFALTQIPGTMILFRALYQRIAANRNCFGDACQLPKQNRYGDYLPLIILPVLALLTRNIFPAWIFMWLLAFSIYFGCKLVTWRRALRQTHDVNISISLGYLFAWVGMDARGFLRGKRDLVAPKPREWLLATVKVILGFFLIWFVARRFLGTQPLAAGWIGMVGIILCLHFGLFQLLALTWQRVGVNAQPIMREPLRSTSLADFWGRRWNAAFHFLANDFAFRPLLRKCGATTATILVFSLSGLIHDFIISLPARGGYGLPTAYFLIQGFGVVFERTTFAKQIGLGRGWRGWLFTAICTIGPTFWLFHPIFVRNVILPMLQAIGAT